MSRRITKHTITTLDPKFMQPKLLVLRIAGFVSVNFIFTLNVLVSADRCWGVLQISRYATGVSQEDVTT